MAGSTLGREFDIARTLKLHGEQINELQKRGLGDFLGTWAAVTLQAGITTLATLNYRQSFGLVFLSGKLTIDAAIGAGGNKTIAAAGSVPNARQSMDYAAAIFDGAHKFAVININATGTITLYAPNALGVNAEVSFNLFYEAA